MKLDIKDLIKPGHGLLNSSTSNFYFLFKI